MSASLSIPADLLDAFRRFQRDFDRVTAQWLVRGEETDESIATARAGLRRILADATPADAWGETRAQRLAHVFAFWRDLAERIAPRGVAVVPCATLAAESRALDRAWKGRGA